MLFIDKSDNINICVSILTHKLSGCKTESLKISSLLIDDVLSSIFDK